MRWWLRAHRAGPVGAVVVGLGALAWASASGRFLDGAVGSPVRPGSAVPISLWLPLTLVAVLCWACSIDATTSPRSVGLRRNGTLLVGYTSATVALAAASLVPAAVVAPSAVGGVGRNVVGLVGLAMILLPRLGSGGAAAATAGYLTVAALVGAGPRGTATWWAWPVAGRVEPWGLAAAVLLWIGGLLVLRGPRRRGASAVAPPTLA